MASLLNQTVLLLNKSYEPLSICNVKRALKLLYLGKAEVVEQNHGLLHSARQTISVPSVIRLARYVKVPYKKVILNRRNLLIRDRSTCQYCGKKTPPLTIDHVVPKQFGGKDDWENLVIACQSCNHRKGNRTPEQAGMRLLRRPSRPSYYFYLQHIAGLDADRWKPYLFLKEN
ncbi:MAG: HNH endonuclease [Calditrichia bacterium]